MKRELRRGAVFALGGAAAFACMSALIKLAGTRLSGGLLVILAALIVVIVRRAPQRCRVHT